MKEHTAIELGVEAPEGLEVQSGAGARLSPGQAALASAGAQLKREATRQRWFDRLPGGGEALVSGCLLYTSPSPRD